MRTTHNPRLQFDQTPIQNIQLDVNSRDEIPKILFGLQHIYCSFELRKKVFVILEKIIADDINTKIGRPGMNLWQILVLGTLRLNCNWDYDKLKEMADNHKTIREMLGLGWKDSNQSYALQTLVDNISLLTPEVLNEINTLVVTEGHKLVMKNNENIMGRCDSTAVKTNVHYPTDFNLLFDSVRKLIQTVALLCDSWGLSAWRQSAHNIKTFKRLMRNLQKIKISRSKDKQAKREKLQKACKEYLDDAQKYVDKATLLLQENKARSITEVAQVEKIQNYIEYAELFIDQISRRIFDDKKIPHDEKIFSIFKPYTEWIVKGKAGIPQELGLTVCIVEDRHRFILHHLVMEHTTDSQVAIDIVDETQKKFPGFVGCSFDKGFWSPQNKENLSEKLEHLTLPKKGKLNAKECEEQNNEMFKETRKQHSAVESAMHTLKNHGLDKCPDYGLDKFKRYISLAVLARNLQVLGSYLQQKQRKKERAKAA